MENVISDKKSYEQLAQDYFQLQEWQKSHRELTRVFIHDISGVMQAILGNAELFKLKYAHKLNGEAVNYLDKIEDNSENLIVLLNSFRETIQSESKNSTD